MKTIAVISLFVMIFVIFFFEYQRNEKIKQMYGYSGKIIERAMVFDFIESNETNKLKNYIEELIKQDIFLLTDKKMLDISSKLGYCRQWKNIENYLDQIDDSDKYKKALHTIKKRCNNKRSN